MNDATRETDGRAHRRVGTEASSAPRTVPELFALAGGLRREGPHRCFYCGAACGADHPAAEFVRDSFTGRPGVRRPGSPWVCPGCVLCLREKADVVMLDGTRRAGQKVRSYSWLVTAREALAGTKADLARWRELCLSPPEPPFAVVLSDSGQTHQLYRGVVNRARGPAVTVTLEGDPVTYRPADLATRLALCGRLAAAAGKPALSGPPDFRLAACVLARYRDGEAYLDLWQRLCAEPLSRLAAWLCPNHEESAREYPADTDTGAPAPGGAGHRGAAAQARRAGGPRPPHGRGGEARGPRGGEPTLFDPG